MTTGIETFWLAGGSSVCLLIAGWFLQRRGVLRFQSNAGTAKRLLEVQQRLFLSTGHSLLLVRAGDRGLLLSVSPTGCTLLESRSWQEWCASGELISS